MLLRDGKPWIPHGFYQIPFEVPPASFPDQKNTFWQEAYEHYSPAEYTEMVQEGADSVRLQIAQDGANPGSAKFYDPQWFQQAVDAIRDARRAGLTVIVSIQDEIQTGVQKKAPLPNEGTREVWRELAPIFGKDRGVLFELYNEPQSPGVPLNTELQPTRQQWEMQFGELFYGAYGIGREDLDAQEKQLISNFYFYGAPVGAILSVDRSLKAHSWWRARSFVPMEELV